MIKVGKKTIAWNKARKELVKEFKDWGITCCEIKLQGCTNGLYLGFAHTRKRRDVTDLKRVVLACSNCHYKIEYNCNYYTDKDMESYLESIIESRSNE